MPLRTGGAAPYAPPASVLQLIDGYRNRGLQTPFTADVLVRAGITESLIPRVIRTLEGLELTDKNGNPTPAMEGLHRAPTEEFKQRLAEIVKSVYAEVFSYTDPATDSPTKIADAFRSYNPIGQRGRMVTLFLGLCEAAGIIKEGTARKQAVAGNGLKKKAEAPRRVPAASVPSRARDGRPSFGGGPGGSNYHPALSGLLASLPTDGDGWTQAQHDTFMTTFEAVLKFVVPIRSQADIDADASTGT